MKEHKTTIIVVVWALSIMVILLGANLQQIVTFDPASKLAQAASQPDFDEQFTRELTDAGIQPGTLVHLQSDQRCYCNQLSDSHQQSLSEDLASEGYQLTQLSLKEHPALTKYISHFPALAVVDTEGHLRYLGPYATGYGCFTGNDLITEISRIATTPEYYGASINSEAKGCFCEV